MNTLSDFLEFSPFDNKVSAEFLKDIPNITTEPDGSIDKVRAFWEKFFVEYSVVQYKDTIDKIRNAINEQNRHYVLFIGPSGSGKTTFLNYLIKYKDQYLNNDLAIDMVNLIENASNAGIGSEIIHDNLDAKIIQYLSQDVIREIAEHIISYEDRESTWNIKWLKGKVSIFYNFISYNRRNFSQYNVLQLCHEIKDISDKISLYFISYIINKCMKEKRPCVFVFDNLDELDQLYLLENLNLDLLTGFSKAQEFFEKVVLDFNYPFLSKCTMVESMRRNYIATVNSTQFIERVEKSSVIINFDSGYMQNGREVVEKRGELHLLANKEDFVKNKLEYAKRFNISIIEKEEKYLERIFRLFNLDYRTTLSSLSEALKKEIVSWGRSAEEDDDCRVGVRGFLLYSILKYRLNKVDTRFKRYLDEDIICNNCNRYRMYLSILANMNTKKEGTDNSLQVSLLDFTERVKEWYKNVTILSVYETLFVSGYHNYSLPAILEGETINKYLRDNKYNVTLQSLCEHLADLYRVDKDSLSDVDIVVNPLCVEYSEHVFIHYEYFNLLSVCSKHSEELLYKSNSLFQYDNLEEIKMCTNQVYDTTASIINKADQHLCIICGKKCVGKTVGCDSAIKKLQDHGFLIQNMLYATRVITSHINYLDSYRKLLWIRFHDNKGLNNDIQNHIVLIIQKYITLFRTKKVQNDSANTLIMHIEQNVDYAKNSGYDIWTPIVTGMDKIETPN